MKGPKTPVSYTWFHGLNSSKLSPIIGCPRKLLHLINIGPENAGLYVLEARLSDGSKYRSKPYHLIVKRKGTSNIIYYLISNT